MKKITMDFVTYEEELTAEKQRGWFQARYQLARIMNVKKEDGVIKMVDSDTHTADQILLKIFDEFWMED